jgi:hypothetical protein
MFDPAGLIYKELEIIQIDAIVVVAHVEVIILLSLFFNL